MSRHPLYREDVRAAVESVPDWSGLRGASVLISGASGMLGVCLIDVLMEANDALGLGLRVLAMARRQATLRQRLAVHADRPELRLIAGDVAAPIAATVPGADYVIHAASNTHPALYAGDPIGTITANVQGTYHLLDYAVRSQARRFCLVSTVEIYGDNRGDQPRFGEHDLGYLDSNTLRAGYPESKRAAEALCQAFRAQHGIEVVVPRLPRIIGPTVLPNDTKAASQFIAKAVADQDIVLKSAGQQYYSFLHVADAVSGLATCLLSGQDGEAYNLAHPSGDIHLRELAALAAEAAGRQVVFELPEASEQRGYSTAVTALLDGTKVAGLGWVPRYDIATAVTRTITVLRDERG